MTAPFSPTNALETMTSKIKAARHRTRPGLGARDVVDGHIPPASSILRTPSNDRALQAGPAARHHPGFPAAARPRRRDGHVCPPIAGQPDALADAVAGAAT